MNDRNPYAPPEVDVAPSVAPIAMPALWNPKAAAGWSLIFTPVFGAVLHMKNWQALGQREKAASARMWAIGSAAYLVLLTIISMALPDSKALDALTKVAGLALLIAWYYANGKAQQSHVLARFGAGYPRRGWGRPLSLALLAYVGYLAVAVAIALLVDAAWGPRPAVYP
jgi:hypothetical protein